MFGINWIYIILICSILSFSGGVLVDHKFNVAAIEKLKEKELTKAQVGQNKIIDFHQKLEKAKQNETDKCLITPVPAGMLALLH